MHPFIQDGDVLVVEPLYGQRPGIGDVLLCRGHQGRLYAHRLIRFARSHQDGGTLVTKGDSSRHFDRPIDPAGVLGRVTAIENGGGKVSLRGLRARALARLWSRLSPGSAWLRNLLRRHRRLLELVPRP
ncbi:MAG: S24/S26 family peptidase [Anaerolineae bacterium]|nr:S24/S26 family peptidase [Anaerolineae bacterium]